MNSFDLPVLLAKAGFERPELAPLYIPDDYFDFSRTTRSIMDVEVGETIVINITLLSRPCAHFKNKPPRISVNASDGEYSFKVSSFNLKEWQRVNSGDVLKVKAKVGEWDGCLQLDSAVIMPPNVWGVSAKYRGDKNDDLAQTIKSQLKDLSPSVEFIRAHFQGLSDSKIMDIGDVRQFELEDMLRSLHQPRSIADAENANRSAVRLEVSALMARVERESRKEVNSKSVINIRGPALAELISSLPFDLSEDQANAIQRISTELRQPMPSDILLSGDVGTGKTAVIGAIVVAAKLLGKKVAILVPNVLLVKQIAFEIESAWGNKIKVARVLPGLKNMPSADDAILVGTTALFSRYGDVLFDLVIVDEQHKLSSEMRTRLCSSHTNLIESTATCVPETAGLILYGSKVVVKLEQCPVKKNIRTVLGDLSERTNFFAIIRSAIAAGGQAAVIYPLVAQKGAAASKSSLEQSIDGWCRAFPGRVGVLHGKMKEPEKESVIQGMNDGLYDLLISTTVIEVGVTLPALRALMVIEPERYGVSQLHQMRGRVARKGGDGDFLMFMTKPINDYELATLDRLNMICREKSGFKLAEFDMNNRGFSVLGDGNGHGIHVGQVFSNLKLMPVDVREALDHITKVKHGVNEMDEWVREASADVVL